MGSGTNVIRAVRADPALAATQLLVTSKVKELGELTARLAMLADPGARSSREAQGAGASMKTFPSTICTA